MSETSSAALAYARRGWRVFPLHGIVNGACTCGATGCSSPGKHPLTRRGLHDATVDPQVIDRWWRQWRRANVAIATGRDSGIIVVDLDLPAAYESLSTLTDGDYTLQRTLTVLTGGGGVHLFYRHPGHDIGNYTGRLPGCPVELPGIDLRADGGYVVATPSTHASGSTYEWLNESGEITGAPTWLHERRPAPAIICGMARASFTGDGSAYGLAVLDSEIQRLRMARAGSRNHTLNRAAFALAQVVAGGELLEAPARAALLAEALMTGLTEHEVSPTIDSAFHAGIRPPT